MTKSINIRRGLDIPLSGKAEGILQPVAASLIGICPDDFPGYTWKCVVKPGDKVAAGSPLFHAKEDETLNITSPICGVVEEVRRGERRKILAVTVKKSSVDEKAELSADDIAGKIKESGLWVMMRQRPYDIVPDTLKNPRDIFVTSFDTAPLAGEVMPSHMKKHLEAGLKALKTLTPGNVYLAVRDASAYSGVSALAVEVSGPHPAGNAGPQIAAIAPVNKGETVWTLDTATAARIGKLIEENIIDYQTEVAITGPAALEPKNVLTAIGASLSEILNGEIPPEGNTRVISGNVLTGVRENVADGFLRWPYRQITLLEEGDKTDEFMGWASLSPSKFSVKRTFPAFLFGKGKSFPFDARIKGGHRAMILSGEMDKVFPFDIYPEYLIKAILAGDYDRMEKLGIYEVAPEDFALPEFVDTSKQPLQQIVRDGLDRLRKDS